jgi:oxygen-dependent protoporphyrinogen oxidase
VGTSSSQLPVAILGGGITGLAAAHRLARQGRAFRLFDAAPRLGGNLRSERSGDWLLEAGPNSLQLTPALAALCAELELRPLIASPAAKNRYLVRNGRVLAAPSSPPGFFKTPLFSTRAKIRLFGDLFQRPRQRPADVSLADFAAEHFGTEVVEYGLRAFVAGVYAGDASQLSARLSFPSLWEAERSHGSVIRGMIAAAKAKKARGEASGPPPLVSFADGLEALPRALAARLPSGSFELQARVSALEASPGKTWTLRWTGPDQAGHSENFASVILALPSTALAALPIGAAGAPGACPLAGLGAITYPPVSSLFLGYTREQVAHPLDGFGMLIPPAEKRDVLGVLFNSTLFPCRAPAGHVGITVMTGGALRPEMALLDDPTLLARVGSDLGSLLGVSGAPVFVRRNVWPRAIPQYNLGYERFLEQITAVENAHPGLLIGGHVRDGIAVPQCLAAGEKLAARALG